MKDSHSGCRGTGMYIGSCYGWQVMQVFQEKDINLY